MHLWLTMYGSLQTQLYFLLHMQKLSYMGSINELYNAKKGNECYLIIDIYQSKHDYPIIPSLM